MIATQYRSQSAPIERQQQQEPPRPPGHEMRLSPLAVLLVPVCVAALLLVWLLWTPLSRAFTSSAGAQDVHALTLAQGVALSDAAARSGGWQ